MENANRANRFLCIIIMYEIRRLATIPSGTTSKQSPTQHSFKQLYANNGLQ